jgi:hypothetical protein
VYAPVVRWSFLPILWLLGLAYLSWWVGANPLPDGFQNEYLHIGNAMDLWGALTDGDIWHLRWFMYTGYWPWGFLAVPWPFMAVIGPTRLALVMGNLIHLAVLLVATQHIGRALGGRLAPLLVILCPGIFGSLVRFEPNLAIVAWTAAGLAALVASRGLESRRHVWLYGVSLGIGLMMDRLTVAFFLLPALVPLLWRAGRAAWLHLAQALGITLVLTGAYYREFFIRHSHEILSQAGTGEIDSAGTLTEVPALIEWAYYPLVLVDSQAGPILGGVMLIGLFARRSRTTLILWASMAGGVLFFSLVSKHQVFYTLPILAPLAALAAAKPRLAWLGLVGGLWSMAAVGLGLVPGGPWLNAAWVSPRHTLARPPIGIEVDLTSALNALGEDNITAPVHVSVLSENQLLFEGFLLLAVRERWPDTPARGVVMDPQGTFEHFHEIDALLWVGPKDTAWPSIEGIEAQLLSDHIDPDTVPPAARVLTSQQVAFEEQGRWPVDDAQDLVVFRRR